MAAAGDVQQLQPATFPQNLTISLTLTLCAIVDVAPAQEADADNRRDAFSGQSMSTNILRFHILGIITFCAIVTLFLRRALITIFDFEKCRDLEIGVRGHSRSLKVATFDRLCMISY